MNIYSKPILKLVSFKEIEAIKARDIEMMQNLLDQHAYENQLNEQFTETTERSYTDIEAEIMKLENLISHIYISLISNRKSVTLLGMLEKIDFEFSDMRKQIDFLDHNYLQKKLKEQTINQRNAHRSEQQKQLNQKHQKFLEQEFNRSTRSRKHFIGRSLNSRILPIKFKEEKIIEGPSLEEIRENRLLYEPGFF